MYLTFTDQCPTCEHVAVVEAHVTDDGHGEYHCEACGTVTAWEVSDVERDLA